MKTASSECKPLDANDLELHPPGASPLASPFSSKTSPHDGETDGTESGILDSSVEALREAVEGLSGEQRAALAAVLAVVRGNDT